MPEVRLTLPCFTQLPSLDNLTGLDVSRNRLKAPPDVSSLSALSSLDIGHNRATSLPEAYRVAVTDDDSTPAAPPAPALTGGDAKITATWAAPAAGLLNGGPTPTTGYQIRYRPSGGEWSVPTAAAGTTATIAGLANTATIAPAPPHAAPLAGATTYDIRVAALNQQTPGPYTTTITTTPPTPTN